MEYINSNYYIDFLGYCNTNQTKINYFNFIFSEMNKIKSKYIHISNNMFKYFSSLYKEEEYDFENLFFNDKQIIECKYDEIIVLSNSKDILKTNEYVTSYKTYNYPNAGCLMTDVETMGNTANSPIISIGAVEFDLLSGQTYREFYMPVSLKSSLDLGTKPNADTILWWMKQSDKARKTITDVKGYNIQHVLKEFRDFIHELKPENLEIWGNSNRFDMGITANSYELLGQDLPWKYTLERDVRTLASFKPEIKEKYKNNFKGVQHDPLDDCKNQIGYCSEIYNDIFVKKT